MRMTVRPAYMGALAGAAGGVIAYAMSTGRLLPLVICLVAFLVAVVYGRDLRDV